MSLIHPNLKVAFAERKALKIITGLNNFNITNIVDTIKAAEIGGATYVDIAANTDIVREIKQVSDLPLCVSSIDPDELLHCASMGADILEIGNFDIFYAQGISFSAEQVLKLAKQVRYLISEIDICVTIPHTLKLSEQVNLAIELEVIGINIIQTEGITTKKYKHKGLLQSVSTSASAMSSTYALSKAVKLPVLTASGINSLSAPISIYYGASGVGMGSAISKLEGIDNKAMYIHEIAKSLSLQSSDSILAGNSLNFQRTKNTTISV